MDWAFALGIYLLGIITGSLVCLAIMSDKPRHANIHCSRDDVEKRARRAF